MEDRNKVTYNGKELEDEHGLHWYHYGARYYDPQLGMWHATDNADEFYSPFVYCSNTPIIAADPDGAVVIFVNGLYFVPAHDGVLYWGDFAMKIHRSFPEEKPYFFDASLGGFWKNTLLKFFTNSATAEGGWNLSHAARLQAGYNKGLEVAGDIIGNLHKDENGIITESIKVVTHSFGSAYGRGLTLGIYKHAQDEGILDQIRIVEVDIAPFQGDKTPGYEGIVNKTFQMGGDLDWISGNNAVINAARIELDQESNTGHSLNDYPVERIIGKFNEFDESGQGD